MPRSGNIYYAEFPAEQKHLPTLVLIHGAGGSSEIWPRQLRRLPGYRVLAVDLPAHGKSHGSVEISITGYAARLLEWMRAIDLERAVIVGHSMGAAIALEMAVQAPQQVTRLILIAAAEHFLVNPGLMEKLAVPRHMQAAVSMIVAWSFAKSADQRLRQLYSKELSNNSPGVLAADFLACSSFDLKGRANRISRPTLVISGRDDVMVLTTKSHELATHLLRGTLKEIEGAGHMVMQEQPAEIAKMIKAEVGKL